MVEQKNSNAFKALLFGSTSLKDKFNQFRSVIAG
jgi:hypothetical protein